MAECVGDFVDLSLLDKVQRQRRFINDINGEVTEQEKRDDLPEDLMSELEKYIGDGQARLTVSGSLSSSHEYHKAEAFVSISVACNNNMNDVEAVHDIVRPCVQDLVQKDHFEMSLLRDTVLPESQRLHSDVTAMVPASEGKVASPPKRSSGIKLAGKRKPDFQRK
jgi:hypothetical protein